MIHGERIVITGATGFLGAQLVRVLLERYPDAHLSLLVRDKRGLSGRDRMAALVPQPAMERIETLSGDVSLPRCGLSEQDYASLANSTTRVIHSAATVRFDQPLDEARRINVEGTRNILDFASEARRAGCLRSLAYVGTAFVAGDRSGLVRETELQAGQEFRNTYERTKFEAETLVRAQLDSIPGVILRPSIIVGDSRTGVTSSFKTLYWPLKIYARRLWRTVPGFPDAVVDVVPVDFVAEAAARLTFEERAFGRTVHLCAGPQGSATLHEIAERAASFFHVPPPRYVNPNVFFAILRPLLFALLWGPKRRVLRDGRSYRAYFSMRMSFDTTVAEELLSPLGLRPLPVLEYLDRLFVYCRETDWGRKPASAH
jgi:long-chain acyl-CoA synthetase